MLERVDITCPRCHEHTTISVSRTDAEERTFATTACRQCHARFIALTEADGRVLLFDGTKPPEPGEQPQLLGIIQPPAGKSGYRVKPPEYLGIFDRGFPPPQPPEGVSDEELAQNFTSLDRILRRPDGSSRPPREAAKHLGWRSVWVAQLNEALTRRLSGPPPLSFPPGIFISYRWGTEEQDQWVAQLARELKGRGYPLTFDRDEAGNSETAVDVPEIVSRIADARYFLAVLDAGYAERIGKSDDEAGAIKDGWVFDEYNVAARLSNARQLRIVGLLRADVPLPRGFRMPQPGTQGNVIDVRRSDALRQVIDDVFPAIANAPDEDAVRRARALLAQSHEDLCAGNLNEAYAAAEELTALLPATIDGPAQKVRVALRANAAEVGLTAAEEALALAPQSRELLRAAGTFASGAGQPKRAAQHLGMFLEAFGEEESTDLAQAHFALGSALDDLGQVHAGIAHLELARRSAPDDANLLNTLGYVYRRAGDSARAIECFTHGLTIEPAHANLLLNAAAALLETAQYDDAAVIIDRLDRAAPGLPQVAGLRDLAAQGVAGVLAEPPVLVAVVQHEAAGVVTCDACAARVPVPDGNGLCARCGSVVPMQPGPCPNCTSDGRVVLIPGLSQQCPYCRRGHVGMA